jgi:hypothetical protein
MKKLFLAAAAVAASLVTPAAAQQVSGSITIGTTDRYAYPGTNYYDQRYGSQFGAGACGLNRTLVQVQGVRSGYGAFYVDNDPTRGNGRLRGERIRPASSFCLNNREARFGSVTIVHDVNNNGYFDRQDGVARVNVNRSNYGAYGAYGRQNVEYARMQYGYRGF